MYPKNPLFQKCLAYLESLPNIKVTIQDEPYFTDAVLADGQLTITNSDQTVNYVCEIKTGLINDLVEPVVKYFTNLGERLKKYEKRPLLITHHLSNLVIDKLIEKNIEFIDVNGNIYLNSPAIYMLVRHQVIRNSINESLELTAAALQVIYALLKQPDLLFKGYTELIASVSGVTSKTVSNTLEKLQKLKYITRKYGIYEIVDYVKLLERWELGYSERLRVKLLIGTFNLAQKRNFSEVEAEILEFANEHSYLIGGELAASIFTQHLRPIGATLHLNKSSNERQIAVKLRLKPDPEGNIILLRNFGHDDHQQNDFGLLGKNLAHPLLIHAELVNTGNSRLKETAQIIYDRYIEEIAQKNDWY